MGIKINETQKEWVHDVLNTECPHCEFIEKVFPEEMSNREYWILTEVFVYLHGADECNFREEPVAPVGIIRKEGEYPKR